ncbi:MAG: CoA ester lyase [Alphaproteobacteria bacterium]|jgi:citrate lyase beta subunit|nr:CoA ester lyase [Alphaproteobacteria bacterium]|tara:strand:+ start:12553 stop:13461 length:909 start_codon:yes stop_codon:yes gene_type:complete
MSQLRRCLLFSPGDSERKITKAAQLEVDSIILDLEDAVCLSHKAKARRTVAEALNTLDFGQSERLIRINAPNTNLLTDDLDATAAAQPDGYVIPKVEAPEHVQSVSQALAKVEHRYGWAPGSIRLLALIETAKGIMNLGAIAQADERLDALLFGAEDLTADIGARRSSDDWEVFYARSAVVTAAAAYELQAIDTVFVTLNDLSALEVKCDFARQMGFDGKLAIHPRQVGVIQSTFTPSAAEIEKAQQLVQAFSEHESAGSGVFEVDGKMVDLPVVRAAKRLLNQAHARQDAGRIMRETKGGG